MIIIRGDTYSHIPNLENLWKYVGGLYGFDIEKLCIQRL